MSSKREVGSARIARNLALREDNWELRFPHSTRVYAKMAREDAQVKSVINAVCLPIRRADWWLDPNGADDEIVQHVSNDLRLNVLGGMPFDSSVSHSAHLSWKSHVEQALKALVYGHMFFEQVYEVGADGKEHLRKLAPRWPGTISKIHVAKDGGLLGITQYGAEGMDPEKPQIPVENLVAYVHDDEGGEWYGTSILRPSYKHWSLRDQLLRLELTILDRNGMGLPVYRGSDFSKNPDSDLENGQRIVEAARSGESSGASIPAGSDLKILGVSGQLVSPREAITYHDRMIAKAVLAHFLNLDSQGGSFALASTQADLFVQALQTIAEWIADVATQHIVEDLVRLAYPDYTGPLPRITCDPIASRKEYTPEQLTSLATSKVIFTDSVLDEHVRRVGGLPPHQPYEDAVKEKKARLEIDQKEGISLSTPASPPDEEGGE